MLTNENLIEEFLCPISVQLVEAQKLDRGVPVPDLR
jgi:hypothetical protein